MFYHLFSFFICSLTSTGQYGHDYQQQAARRAREEAKREQEASRRAFEAQRRQDRRRRHELVKTFANHRRVIPAQLSSSFDGQLPPFSLDSVHYPEDHARLNFLRTRVEENDFRVMDPHMAVFVHDIARFISFFDEHLRNDVRVIRTIVFERTTVDFPTLNELLSRFTHPLVISFRDVDFDMSSWRNQNDQEFLFGPASNPRLVFFNNCRFLENFARVIFRSGPERFVINEAGDGMESIGPYQRHEIMANRIPVNFYRRIVENRDFIRLLDTG